MKYQTLDQLQEVAEITGHDRVPMTRGERLERWAQFLEREPDRRLATLHQTEYQPFATRETLRASGSPISIAFEDAVLRGEGLQGDSYGDAKRFFELSDGQLHDIVCYCHYGESVSAATAARYVRAAASRSRQGVLSRIQEAMIW